MSLKDEMTKMALLSLRAKENIEKESWLLESVSLSYNMTGGVICISVDGKHAGITISDIDSTAALERAAYILYAREMVRLNLDQTAILKAIATYLKERGTEEDMHLLNDLESHFELGDL